MSNNTSTSKEKNTALRLLALAGVIAAVIIIAWLTVKIVNVVPNAFSSLASLADGIAETEEDIEDREPAVLVMKSSATEVIEGEQFIVSWEDIGIEGNYFLSFDCIDGLSVSAVKDSEVRALTCDTSYNLGDTDSVALIFDSAADDVLELGYSIEFKPQNSQTGTFSKSYAVVAISPDVDVVIEDKDDVADETDIDPQPEPTPQPQPEPEVTYEYTYAIPVSDPNGRIDLAIRFIDVGEIVNGRFRSGDLEEGSDGAIQFEVRNIGTKTSQDWSFEIELPDGSTYRSDDQLPLRPNEWSTLTLGFDTEDDGRFTFEAEVNTDRDARSSNNSFRETVRIED